MDGTVVGAHKAPQDRGARVRQHRRRPARQDGRHQPAMRGDGRVADGVDAAVQHVQALPRDSSLDRRRVDPLPQELATGHDAVLTGRKPGDDRVRPDRQHPPVRSSRCGFGSGSDLKRQRVIERSAVCRFGRGHDTA
jgi:hypothetical protein